VTIYKRSATFAWSVTNDTIYDKIYHMYLMDVRKSKGYY